LEIGYISQKKKIGIKIIGLFLGEIGIITPSGLNIWVLPFSNPFR